MRAGNPPEAFMVRGVVAHVKDGNIGTVDFPPRWVSRTVPANLGPLLNSLVILRLIGPYDHLRLRAKIRQDCDRIFCDARLSRGDRRKPVDLHDASIRTTLSQEISSDL